MPEVTINLDSKHYKKLVKNMPFQIKKGSSLLDVNNHAVTIDVSPQFEKKLKKAINKDAGIRFAKDAKHIFGGSLIAQGQKLAKSVPRNFNRLVGGSMIDKIAKDIVKKVTKPIVPIGGKVNMKAAKKAFSTIGKVIEKTVVPIGKAAGKPFEKTVMINPFTMGYELGKDVIGPEINDAISKGKGVRPAKGSPEAKARMAALRAMKKGGSGVAPASFAPNGGSFKSAGGSFRENGGSMISPGPIVQKGPAKRKPLTMEGSGVKRRMKKGKGFLIE